MWGLILEKWIGVATGEGKILAHLESDSTTPEVRSKTHHPVSQDSGFPYKAAETVSPLPHLHPNTEP